MIAAGLGDLQALHLLFAAGAQVQPRDSRGETCFHYAARGVHVEAFTFLAAQRGAKEVFRHHGEELRRLADKSRGLPWTRRSQAHAEYAAEVARLSTPSPRRRSSTTIPRYGPHSVKPECITGGHLRKLFPDAVKDEIPPSRELHSVSGLVLAHAAGPLARCALTSVSSQMLASNEGVQSVCASRALESLQRTRVLGRGTYGQVIEVRSESLPRPSSLLSLASMGSESLIRRERVWTGAGSFAMKLQTKTKGPQQDLHDWQACVEAVALKRVAHPFIVRLVHAFQTPQFFVLLLELCPGGDLNQLLCANTDSFGSCMGLPPTRAAQYAGQVLLALVYLHNEQRLVYRDLKPGNVLLGEGDVAKLADFGCAKYVGSMKCSKSASRRKMSLTGTPGFLAPELIFGTDESDVEDDGEITVDPFKTDAYSYGVTLMLMLMGESVAERVGGGGDDECDMLVPRLGDETEVETTLQYAVSADRVSTEARGLLLSLLAYRPSRRAYLADEATLRHSFFLKALDCEDLAEFLWPAPDSP